MLCILCSLFSSPRLFCGVNMTDLEKLELSYRELQFFFPFQMFLWFFSESIRIGIYYGILVKHRKDAMKPVA